MKKLINAAIFIGLMATYVVSAQTVEVEKTHELSKRAKRGYLYHVNIDKQTGGVDLIFITSQNKRRIKLEIYSFDKDYNLTDQRQEEQEIENNKVKIRIRDSDVEVKVKYREPFTTDGISVGGSFTGTLVLRRKRVSYTWNTFWGQYTKKVELSEKLKPRTDEGDKYLLVNHYEDDYTGDAVVIATPKNEMGYKRFTLMRFNKELELVTKKDIDFEYNMGVFYKNLVTETSPQDEDIEIVKEAFFMFAPSKFGKNKAPREKTNDFEIVRFDNDFNVVRVPFKAATSLWSIYNEVGHKDSYYFYGLAADVQNKYFDQIVKPGKFKSIQLMKFNMAANKVDYITNTNLDEMKNKIKTPPAQKRKPVFKPSSFSRKQMLINDRDEFILAGQNYKTSKKGVVYQDIVGFYFNNRGELRAMYGIDPIENNQYAKSNGAPQYIVNESQSGENMYWILTEIDGYDKDDARLEYYPRIAKISKNDASIGNFTTLGVLNKKKFYLDKKYPFFNPEPYKITFFGSTSNGKHIYFGRVRLE